MDVSYNNSSRGGKCTDGEEAVMTSTPFFIDTFSPLSSSLLSLRDYTEQTVEQSCGERERENRLEFCF